jgi:hypothetical protein
MNKFITFVAAHSWLGWILFLRRFAYISLRLIQWDPSSLVRYLLQLPFILTGLAAWVGGFYEGMMQKQSSQTR